MLSQDYNGFKQRLAISDKAFRYTETADKSENELIALCPTDMAPVNRRKLARKYSYANLLYEHIRCGFIHTYRPTRFATSDDALRGIFEQDPSRITYVNYLASEAARKIHFPLEWISGAAKNIAAGLDIEYARHGKVFGEALERPAPATWWLDGA